ncbi:uncharacterized protein LOC143785090 [Ranitomeya variabilis]|uniref:uncharacterized protein LOC143785090 n=1 Tax=Ranitomeya variabilis TaxID=490064 RepID=UPI004056B9AB
MADVVPIFKKGKMVDPGNNVRCGCRTFCCKAQYRQLPSSMQQVVLSINNRQEDSTQVKKDMNDHQSQQECMEPSEQCKEGEMHIPENLDTAPLQALQFIKSELLKTQKSIQDLQSERRLLRKQLCHWTGAVQVLQESQEDNHGKVDAQIHMLAESNECMKKELKELKHNMQVWYCDISQVIRVCFQVFVKKMICP